MHRIRNVLTNRVLKKSLGDHGTWLPIRPAVTYVYTLPLPSVAEHRAQPIAFIMQLNKRILLSMVETGSIAADSWVICETRGWLLETLENYVGVTLRSID